jgi:hypothetical protein
MQGSGEALRAAVALPPKKGPVFPGLFSFALLRRATASHFRQGMSSI